MPPSCIYGFRARHGRQDKTSRQLDVESWTDWKECAMRLSELMSSGTPQPITRWGNGVLHRPARTVTEFGPDLWNLLCDMFATNSATEGAGLAAPHISVDLAVFIYDCPDAYGRQRQGLICNPNVTLAAEPQNDTAPEGCLSLPGAYLPVTDRRLRNTSSRICSVHFGCTSHAIPTRIRTSRNVEG